MKNDQVKHEKCFIDKIFLEKCETQLLFCSIGLDRDNMISWVN